MTMGRCPPTRPSAMRLLLMYEAALEVRGRPPSAMLLRLKTKPSAGGKP